MKLIKISFVFLLLIILGCSNESSPTKSDENSYSYELAFQFETVDSPQSLIIDNENQFIYISSGNYHYQYDSLLIQKFNLYGELLTTIVNFRNYSNGLYEKYSPIDVTLDDGHNICVLAKPYKKLDNNEYWEPYEGFCILMHNSDGEFLKELDYSQIDMVFDPEAITFQRDIFYVINHYSLFKISKTSEQLTEITLYEWKENTFPENLISDLVVNIDNSIWFVGQIFIEPLYLSTYVAKMDSEYNEKLRFNSISKTEFYGAGISQPSIALDENGKLYLVTFYCKSLEIYGTSGLLLGYFDFSKEINTDVLPVDIGIDRSRNVYVLDHFNNMVYVLKNKKA